MTTRIGPLCCLAMIGVLLAGCQFSHAVVNTTSAVPMSATGSVHDPQGQLATSKEGYKVVKTIEGTQTQWRIFWFLPLSEEEIDAYDVLCENENCPARDQGDGQAIVSVESKLVGHWSTWFLWPGLILPIFPTANSVYVKGTIVEFEDSPSGDTQLLSEPDSKD